MRESLAVTTPWGDLVAAAENGALVRIFLPGEKPDEPLTGSRDPLLAKAASELQEYFCGRRKEFDLPLDPAGTAFQRKVWRELCRIPYGTTATYGEIAGRLGIPRGARAVGQANHQNPIPIIIPCHRVIAAGDKIGGYGGGIDLKIKLLALEGVTRLISSAR